MQKGGATQNVDAETTRLTLEIWHPNCWTLEVTEAVDAGIVAHTVNNVPGDTVQGHFTVYADRITSVDELIEAARRSRLTGSVTELSSRREFEKNVSNIGNTTREIVVEYDPANSIAGALLSRGFVHEAPVRVHDGREYWPVIDTEERDGLEDRLESLREEKDADVSVTKVASVADPRHHVVHQQSKLSNRQREVLELACRRNYYAWPRGTTTRELAEELGISKTTVLEHLRKAEAKLLDQYS